MCGIFGLAFGTSSDIGSQTILALTKELFAVSENRGREAAGIAIQTGDQLRFFKRSIPAGKMIRTPAFRDFFTECMNARQPGEAFALIGHSRLVTNGTQGVDDNNQPVATENSVGVHNGIIVNDGALWLAHPDISRKYDVDTEVLYRLIDKHYHATGSLAGAMARTYQEIEGEASIAFIFGAERKLALASNVGSLYFAHAEERSAFVFASEKYFLQEVLKHSSFKCADSRLEPRQIRSGEAIILDIAKGNRRDFVLADASGETGAGKTTSLSISNASPRRVVLRRCTHCVLPHTFPFITFDAQGVCNYCREKQHVSADNRDTLEQKLSRVRSKDGSPDCIVALSGGRDSCYGLHYIKEELGMHPIAYTYDWAMVTDEARRNSARVCGKLGVEHIIRSADITTKRRNIRLNIEAWLARPELGMIPLFMAGDKQFFHYATQVSRQTALPLVFFCAGNNLEITRFKTGFCGVKDKSNDQMLGLDIAGKIKLLSYYAGNVLLNPRYLNRSMLDSLFAFYSTYVSRQEFIYLYRYINWDEKVIGATLKENYGWESAGDSTSTWRIGDGTASFYNYIYNTIAGFSEHDTFRSNQIRAGLITREEAVEALEKDNAPRYQSMREYAQLVGFNLDTALAIINNAPKLT